MNIDAFFNESEQHAGKQFMEQGYLVFPLEQNKRFNLLRRLIYQWGCAFLGGEVAAEEDGFYDEIHHLLGTHDLNDFRLALIHKLSAQQGLHADLYHMAREALHLLVGNELAMQRGLNLSIQLPDDESSLLPAHSDVWSGNSPYEVVFWLPLVDCYRTRAMYLLPKPLSDEVTAEFSKYSHLSAEDFFREIESMVEWVEVKRGEGLIFWHGLVHGNQINREPLARWSMNIRFKGLLSPYGDKEVGESFFPITVRPATRLGYAYRSPEC